MKGVAGLYIDRQKYGRRAHGPLERSAQTSRHARALRDTAVDTACHPRARHVILRTRDARMMTVSEVFICLASAAVCGGLVRKVPVPLPLLQTAAGALLAWPIGRHFELEPEVFLLVFIAPLLFIDGFRIPKREFRRFQRTILMMAFGLVVLNVLGIGLVITWCLPAIPKPVAFAIAAALSPTDAVAVSGITGRTKVPASLMHVLSGEALMNDASGLVCLRVAIAAGATGVFSWSGAARSLVLVALGGLAVGIGITWLFAKAMRLVFGSNEDAGPRILLIMLLPYAAYLAAESVHLSGILAAAAAGMALPRFEVVEVDHRVARRTTSVVLSMTEVALNGLVFIMLGLQLPHIVGQAGATARSAGLASPLPLLVTVLVVSFGMFAIRFAWVWVSMRVTVFRARARGEKRPLLPLRVVFATALAGVRGAVSLAAALTVPATLSGSDYPARDVAVAVAALVILVSLASASIGLPLALRGVELHPARSRTEEELPLRAVVIEEAVTAVEEARDARVRGAPEDADVVLEAATLVLDRYHARASTDANDRTARVLAEERALRAVGVQAERARLHELWRDQKIDDVFYRRVLRELDAVDELEAAPRSTHHG